MRRTHTQRHRVTLLLRRWSISAASMTVCMARLESGCSVTVPTFLRRWRTSSMKAPMRSNMPCTFWFCSPSLLITAISLLLLLLLFLLTAISEFSPQRQEMDWFYCTMAIEFRSNVLQCSGELMGYLLVCKPFCFVAGEFPSTQVTAIPNVSDLVGSQRIHRTV